MIPLEQPSLHIESKGTNSSVVPVSIIKKWVEQITRDCPKEMSPVLFHKANGQPLTVMLLLETFNKLVDKTSKFVHGNILSDSSISPSKELSKEAIGKAAYDKLYGIVSFNIPVVYYVYQTEPLEMVCFMRAFDYISFLKNGMHESTADTTV